MSVYEKIVATAGEIRASDFVVVPAPDGRFDVEVWAIDRVRTGNTEEVSFNARRAEVHNLTLPKSTDFVVSREGPRETPLIDRELYLATAAISAISAVVYGLEGELAHEIRVRLDKYRQDRQALR